MTATAQDRTTGGAGSPAPAARPASRRRRRHESLRLGGGISPRLYVAVAASAFVLLFAIWLALTVTGAVPPLFLPTPGEVLDRLLTLAADGTLWNDILVSVGRTPATANLGLENTKVSRDEKGFIVVNERQETADPAIYAIGDVAGGILLAHKASKEARIAVEVMTGEASAFEDIIIPAVVFTDPEIAWCGLTEQEAKEKKIPFEVVRFPWSASGRAASMGITRGMTKMIIDAETERVLGVGIVGRGAGEMIAEGVLAVEMGVLAEDLALSMHPHPTLSESEEEAAEAFLGSSTHILPQRRP